MAENAWNSRDPERVSLAYSEDSRWRNRSEFFSGRPAIVAFLQRKWQKELDYRLIKELWAFTDNRIGVRFLYEWHDDAGAWYRSYGNELWEFDDAGLMRRRHASINDVAIVEAILGMSRTLGLQIIAEGVESEAQLSILQQLGCEAGQGYLFSRPLPPPELALWLQRTQQGA